MSKFVYYFNDSIDVDTVNSLISVLHGYEEVDLYFTTTGGEIDAMSVLIAYLNLRKDNIKLFLTDRIISAGTDLLVSCNCEVILTEQLDLIIFHSGGRLIHSHREENWDADVIKNQDSLNNKIKRGKYLKLGLTKKEVSRIKKGKDVILYRKDFDRLNVGVSSKR